MNILERRCAIFKAILTRQQSKVCSNERWKILNRNKIREQRSKHICKFICNCGSIVYFGRRRIEGA